MSANAILVVGAAGRIGRATAKKLVADGCFVLLADRDARAVQALAAELGASAASALPLDVTDLAAVTGAVDAWVDTHGAFAGLVNAAGGRSGVAAGPFSESDPASWGPIIDLHLRGVLNACRAVLPGMIAAKRGAIVSLVAAEGLRGDPASPMFSIAKAAVIVLTEQLVRECSPAGVRVNTLLPGHPQGLLRSGIADDAALVADSVAYLLSERAALVNGACLDASGGWALH